MIGITTALITSLLIQTANAFSFSFSSRYVGCTIQSSPLSDPFHRVAQCASLSVTWDGGTAPWNLVLIPIGWSIQLTLFRL